MSCDGSKGQGHAGEEETKPGGQRVRGQFSPREEGKDTGRVLQRPDPAGGCRARRRQRQDVAPEGPMGPKHPGPDPARALPWGTREPPGVWSRVQGQIRISGYFTKNSAGWTEGTGQVALHSFNSPTKPPAP